jgi:hypothetical protein
MVLRTISDAGATAAFGGMEKEPPPRAKRERLPGMGPESTRPGPSQKRRRKQCELPSTMAP